MKIDPKDGEDFHRIVALVVAGLSTLTVEFDGKGKRPVKAEKIMVYVLGEQTCRLPAIASLLGKTKEFAQLLKSESDAFSVDNRKHWAKLAMMFGKTIIVGKNEAGGVDESFRYLPDGSVEQ